MIEYEVTYPLTFVVSVDEDATDDEIVESYVNMLDEWVREGNLPVREFLEIKPLTWGKGDEQ